MDVKQTQIKYGLAASLMLFSMVSCGSPPTDRVQDPAADLSGGAVADEVWASASAIVTAFNDKDAEKAVSYNAPDFIQMFHGQPNADYADHLPNTRKQFADPAVKLSVSQEKVDVAQAGDMAIYTARYIYNFTDPADSEVVTEHGNWVMIFRRQSDSSMKVYREIISDIPPAPSVSKGSAL